MSVTIRPLIFNDFPEWLPLWVENNQGHNDDAVTTQTWQRMTSDTENVHGFGAFNGERLVGMLHYILHPVTGSLAHACYMQDLYTHPDHRGKGIAKKMLNALLKEHKKQKWARIYWVAENSNEAAQKLYKSFGNKIEFSFHVLI